MMMTESNCRRVSRVRVRRRGGHGHALLDRLQMTVCERDMMTSPTQVTFSVASCDEVRWWNAKWHK